MPPLEADELEAFSDGRFVRLTLRSGEAAMSVLVDDDRAKLIRNAFADHVRTLSAANAALADAQASLRRRAAREARRG